MKTILQKAAAVIMIAIPALLSAQTAKNNLAVDLTIGINYSYDPPSNCNNLLGNIDVDVCNNGANSAGSFLVGIYLYEPATQKHWVLDQTTLNSLSGSACVNINNWNINMNNYASLPAPGNNYRIGVWADTADVITESNENNNASLLSGNIQVCAAPNGIRTLSRVASAFHLFPNPMINNGSLTFNLSKAENVSVTIYGLNGKMVLKAFEGNLMAGSQKIDLDVSKINEGVYFTEIKTSEGIITRKLIVQK